MGNGTGDATRITRLSGTGKMESVTSHSVEIICDAADTDKLKYKDATNAVRTLVNTDEVQTLANKTLTAPVLSGVSGTVPFTGDGIGGIVVCKRILFTEDAASLTHTATIVLPPNATLLDIIVSGGVVWNAATTSATLKVGDTAVSNGYFTGVNLKATDLLAGETLAISGSNVAASGGKQGAYLVAATGQRGATSANFGAHNTAGTNIIAVVTVVGPGGTTGRTYVDVFYAVGEVVTPVLA